MIDASKIALSGLHAAERRIGVSASNVANLSSTVRTAEDGSLVNDPYRPQRVVQSSLSSGGVRADVVELSNPTIRVADPTSPVADENGTVEIPNISLEEEVMNQIQASYDYKANLKVIKVQKELDKALLDINA
jgi:flagellar basal-body rod protein FlgC